MELNRAMELDRAAKDGELKIARRINEGTSFSFVILSFVLAAVTIAYGGLYMHESLAKPDDTINVGLYWATYPVILAAMVGIAWFSVDYGEFKIRKTGGTPRGRYILICGCLILVSLFSQVGVYNALTTPNTHELNTLGLILGSIVVGVGVIIFGVAVFLAVKFHQTSPQAPKGDEEVGLP